MKILPIAITALIGGLILFGCRESPTPTPSLESYAERGEYAVGVRAMYFHDPNRAFDGWNAKHASDNYKKTLEEINAAGDNQIVAAHMWYPASASDSARKATFDDFSNSRSVAFRTAYEFGLQFYMSSLTSGGGDVLSDPGAMQTISAEVKSRIIDSLYQPPIADGSFPVIVAAHGLGGSSLGWATFAEYLASHGYVVVAPSFISDSSTPNALDSPDSKYANKADAAALDGAYQTILGEFKVIPGFYKYFFGYEGMVGFEGPQGLPEMSAVPGGGQKVGEMMGEFFTQRVGDVETIIDGLHSLNEGGESCAAEYSARGQPVHGGEVCGLFSGSLDVENIGVMGHSLGSMTAQFTVAKSDKVAAAVGYNNGPPRYWEPEGIFGDGAAEDGQPAGSPGPVMQIHGSEDAFVQGVFRGLMWNALTAAGGNPQDIWLLEQERALPTDENPQPIARNAYNRATGDKVIISVKDVNHGSLVDDFPTVVSQRAPLVVNGKEYWSASAPAQRKAVGQDVFDPAFQGQPYTPLGWDTVEGSELYMPAFIRNYYTKNWFDFYLKGNEEAVRFTENPIEDKGILDIRSSLSGR